MTCGLVELCGYRFLRGRRIEDPASRIRTSAYLSEPMLPAAETLCSGLEDALLGLQPSLRCCVICRTMLGKEITQQRALDFRKLFSIFWQNQEV